MFETVVTCSDKSYFTDELEKLTGRPRSYWAQFTFRYLKERLYRELRNQPNNQKETDMDEQLIESIFAPEDRPRELHFS